MQVSVAVRCARLRKDLDDGGLSYEAVHLGATRKCSQSASYPKPHSEVAWTATAALKSAVRAEGPVLLGMRCKAALLSLSNPSAAILVTQRSLRLAAVCEKDTQQHERSSDWPWVNHPWSR